MKLYNCKIRLHGNPLDETRKRGVTAGEIRLLKQIHGDDAVLEVTPTGEVAANDAGEPRSEAEERARLERIYGEKPVSKMFGVKQASINDDLPEDKPLKVVRRGKADDADALVA